MFLKMQLYLTQIVFLFFRGQKGKFSGLPFNHRTKALHAKFMYGKSSVHASSQLRATSFFPNQIGLEMGIT